MLMTMPGDVSDGSPAFCSARTSAAAVSSRALRGFFQVTSSSDRRGGVLRVTRRGGEHVPLKAERTAVFGLDAVAEDVHLRGRPGGTSASCGT